MPRKPDNRINMDIEAARRDLTMLVQHPGFKRLIEALEGKMRADTATLRNYNPLTVDGQKFMLHAQGRIEFLDQLVTAFEDNPAGLVGTLADLTARIK